MFRSSLARCAAVLVVVSALVVALPALMLRAQDATPTVQPGIGAVPIVPTVSFAPIATRAAMYAGDDARAGVCAAATRPDFAPHIVREGDTLARLLVNAEAFTPTQIAALNCLDDPNALPVGAAIWLPVRVEAAPSNPAAPAAVDGTQILAFETDAGDAAVQNSEGVTLTWEAVGSVAYLYPCPPDEDAPCRLPAYAPARPLIGAQALTGFQVAGDYRWRLEVRGADDAVEVRDVAFTVECSHDAIAAVAGTDGERCPDEPPRAFFAVWQPFEGGVMLYFGDSAEIYVMTNDGRVTVYDDTFVEGMDEPEVEAPDDRFAAVRGFGVVWRALGGEDSPLGWALAQEIGFDSARQAAGRVSYTTYVQGTGATVYAVTFVPGDAAGYWTTVRE